MRGWMCSLCKNVNEFNVLIIVSPTIDEDNTAEIKLIFNIYIYCFNVNINVY